MGPPGPTWKIVLNDTFEEKNCRLILVKASTIIVYKKITFFPGKGCRYERVKKEIVRVIDKDGIHARVVGKV